MLSPVIVHSSRALLSSPIALNTLSILVRLMHEHDDKTGNLGLTHGFFLDMGGIALDMTNDPERVWPTGYNRVTISAEGYFYLLGQGFGDILPDFHRSQKRLSRTRARPTG